MKLKILVYREDILKNTECIPSIYREKYKGTIDGYVSIDGRVYAIVFFGELHRIIKIPIEEIITDGYE